MNNAYASAAKLDQIASAIRAASEPPEREKLLREFTEFYRSVSPNGNAETALYHRGIDLDCM